MITDEEIADLIDAHSSSGLLGDLKVFSFAREIERISRQHQRERDAGRVRFSAAGFCGGSFETVMRSVAQSIEEDTGEFK